MSYRKVALGQSTITSMLSQPVQLPALKLVGTTEPTALPKLTLSTKLTSMIGAPAAAAAPTTQQPPAMTPPPDTYAPPAPPSTIVPNDQTPSGQAVLPVAQAAPTFAPYAKFREAWIDGSQLRLNRMVFGGGALVVGALVYWRTKSPGIAVAAAGGTAVLAPALIGPVGISMR